MIHNIELQHNEGIERMIFADTITVNEQPSFACCACKHKGSGCAHFKLRDIRMWERGVIRDFLSERGDE